MDDPGLNKKEAIYLPRLAWDLGQLVHDHTRQLNTIGQIVSANHASGAMRSQYNPVPYNIGFFLYVYAKNMEDGNKIIEQILPYFGPEFTIAADLIPELNVVEKNIPIVLDSIEYEDRRDGSFEERRAIVWTLSFTLKGWFYGPIDEAKVIRFANVTFYDSTLYQDIKDSIGVAPKIDRVTAQPGLTANGEPTSNADLSIPISQINSDDNYGYVMDIYGVIENYD